MKILKILVAGDVVGNPGRKACEAVIPRLRETEELDLVIANGENMAGGSGITESTCRALFDAGVDVITSGDHVFKKKEAEELLQQSSHILRPANYPKGVPGSGSTVVTTHEGFKIGVLNLIGRVFLKTVDCPFEAAQREVARLVRETPIIFVDFHAEATSEKVALGWFLDGKVSGIFGTHTHIQTADEQILPQGTGYITELGMCGPYRSVIGRDIPGVMHMFLTQMPAKFDVATEDVRFSGALFEVDSETGKTVAIRRIHQKVC